MEQRPKTVLALGFFDGVHIGHAALLNAAKARAAALGAEPAVLTFDLHPDIFVKKTPVPLLCSPADRAYIIRRFFGIERTYCIHFNEHTMHMPWREFLDGVCAEYNAVGFVVGYDFRFGDRGEGDGEKLASYCAARGLGCDIIPAVTLDGEIVSSTRIRALVAAGEMERTAALLGHPHLLTDNVRSGLRLGRRLASPTINMRFEPGVLIPRRGVYATRVVLPDGEHPAVTNIGTRPTVGGENVTVESNILHFTGDLYGKRVCVELAHFLRDERKFDSVEALGEQIRRDARHAGELLECD